MMTLGSSHKECFYFLKPVGSGPFPEARSGRSIGPSVFRPRERAAFTGHAGKSSYTSLACGGMDQVTELPPAVAFKHKAGSISQFYSERHLIAY